jgi:hypothetical protein
MWVLEVLFGRQSVLPTAPLIRRMKMSEQTKPADGRVFLRVKLKSLAAEARMIRLEERRTKGTKDRLVKLNPEKAHDRDPRLWKTRHGNKPGWHEDPDRFRKYERLYSHRVGEVRSAARSTLLAYGFLRGTPLAKIEPKTRPDAGYQRYRASAHKAAAGLVNVYGIQASNRLSTDSYVAAKGDEAARFARWLKGDT